MYDTRGDDSKKSNAVSATNPLLRVRDDLYSIYNYYYYCCKTPGLQYV